MTNGKKSGNGFVAAAVGIFIAAVLFIGCDRLGFFS